MGNERPFREIDHSGDIGIEARGADLGELIENVTRGLFSLLCRGTVNRVVERRLRVASRSVEDLVVDWLNEVVAAVGTHGELYGSVEVSRADERGTEGVLRGERVDPDRHELRFDVKAATYHRIEVRRTEEGWSARVIFDL